MKSTTGSSRFWTKSLPLLVLLLCVHGRAHAQSADSVRVTNVRFEMSGNKVVIHYDLLNDASVAGRLRASSRQGVAAKSQAQGADLGQLIASVADQSRDESPAPPDREFKVAVVLRKESDPLFRFKPRKLTGDVGILHSMGRNKQIVWDIAREFPQGIDGNDFYFELQTEMLTKGNSSMWWIGGGAAVIAGGIVTYFVLSSGKVGPPSSSADFPPPPGRPR